MTSAAEPVETPSLLRASEVAKKPVVTFGGEDVAQIRDIVYGQNGGSVLGFTLAGRGWFAGPLSTVLRWQSVVGLGPDAVVIRDEQSLEPPEELLAGAAAGATGGGGGDVLRSEVLTDDGVALGRVADVVLEVVTSGAPHADVVGYEIEPTDAVGRGAKRLYIPLPDTLAASGEHLIVPAAAREFLRDDLAGFGAAVEDFRRRLAAGTPTPAPPVDATAPAAAQPDGGSTPLRAAPAQESAPAQPDLPPPPPPQYRDR